MEPDSSLPFPRRPTTGPYLSPDQASPRPSICLKISFDILPIYTQVFQAVPFLHVPPPQKKSVYISLLPHTSHTPRPYILLGLITRRIVYFL